MARSRPAGRCRARGGAKTTGAARPVAELAEHGVVEAQARPDGADDGGHECLRARRPGPAARPARPAAGRCCTAPSARCRVTASRAQSERGAGPKMPAQGQRGGGLGTRRQRGREIGEGEVLGGPVDGRLAQDEADGRRDAWAGPGLATRPRRRPERLAPERHPEPKRHIGRAVQQRTQVRSDPCQVVRWPDSRDWTKARTTRVLSSKTDQAFRSRH